MRKLYVLSIVLINLYSCLVLANEKTAELFKYFNSQDWSQGERLSREIGDKVLLKLVLSQKYLGTKKGKVNFVEVIKFINENPTWPQIQKLKIKAEQLIDENTDQSMIVKWFDKNKPLTDLGCKHYAKALRGPINQESIKIIKHGWVYGDFENVQEEQEYYSKYKKYLTEQDHIRRVDEHLWYLDVAEAQRSIHLLPKNAQAAAIAQIAAIKKQNNADELFNRVPEKNYSSGLLFWYLKYKEKEEPNKRIIKLFNKIPSDPKHGHQWWRLQAFYARELIKDKNYLDAYNIIAKHFANNPSDASDAEFMAGWLALEYLRNPTKALVHFQKLNEMVKQPISLARAKYWLGRTYEKLNNKENARKFYTQAKQYSYTFYGQVAAIELGDEKIILPAMPKREHHHQKNLEKNDVVRAAKLLVKYGKPDLAQLYVKSALGNIKDPGEMLHVIEIVKAYKNTYYLVEAAKTASQNHVFIKDFAFPDPYNMNNIPVEQAFAYGIIRQESVFNQYAISTANAMGLMQLAKGTACDNAKELKISCNVAKLTKDPTYNIKLGTHHLKDLLEINEGSYIITIAGYNAGNNRVKKWLPIYGDPRVMKNYREIINWLESIPLYETRNYVQRVLENIQVYRTILNKNDKLRLKKDLIKT